MNKSLTDKTWLVNIYSVFFENHGFWLLCLTVFLLSFPTAMPLWSMSLFLFSGLIYWIKDFNRLISQFRKDAFIISLPLLYVVLNLIWAIIQRPPLHSYSDSILFLVVPIFGYPVFKSSYFGKNFHTVLRYFIAGLVVVCVFDFARAFINSITITDNGISFNPLIDPRISKASIDILSSQSRFRSLELSLFENPTYLSLKALFALYLIVAFSKEMRISKIKVILLTVLFAVFIFSLSARASFLSAAALIIYKSYTYFSQRRLIWLWVIFFPVIIFGFFKISMMNTRIRQKTEVLIANIKSNINELKKSDSRILAWTTSLELIREKPFLGYGLHSRDKLAEEYRKNGFEYEASVHLNPHNQFLETQLAFGLPGTMLLILMLFSPLLLLKDKDYRRMYIPFFILFLCFLLFASLLNGVWGAVFFILFYCMILLQGTKAELESSLNGQF